jgi:hypothetical protein
VAQRERLRLVVDIGDAPLLHEYVTQMDSFLILNRYALGRVFQAAELSTTARRSPLDDFMRERRVSRFVEAPPIRVLRSTLSSPWTIILQQHAAGPLFWLAAGGLALKYANVSLQSAIGTVLNLKKSNQERSQAQEVHDVEIAERRTELSHRQLVNSLEFLERYDRLVAERFAVDPDRIVGTDTFGVNYEAVTEAASSFGQISEIQIEGPQIELRRQRDRVELERDIERRQQEQERELRRRQLEREEPEIGD